MRRHFHIISFVKYFNDHYDVIVIGAAPAGLTCAIELAKKGKDVLVLERHNLPGGVASSFVRDGVEFEATLHELFNCGDDERTINLNKFFKSINEPIDFIPLDESYRFIDKNNDIVVPYGFENAAKAIDAKYPGNYEKLMQFFHLTEEVNLSLTKLQKGINPKELFTVHKNTFLTARKTVKDVLNDFKFSKEVQEIVGIYWQYLGTPPDVLPFTVFAVVAAEYLGKPPYIPPHRSFEIAIKLHEAARKLGVQIEYGQHVKNILVKKRKAYGVITSNGEEIHSDAVVSGSYPETVYSKMIYPSEEVPKKAKKFIKTRETSLTSYGIQLLLDKSADELGFDSYSYFMTPNVCDSKEIYENMDSMGPYDFLVVVCLNKAIPDASPSGTSLLNIVAMPRTDAWEAITKEAYHKVKRKIANDMIDTFEKCLKKEIRSHIIDIIYQTPVTYAHYTDAYKGSVYGYKHSMHDHVIARNLQNNKDRFIKRLYFAGAHASAGDGQVPQFQNGMIAANDVLKDLKKRGNRNGKKVKA